MPAHRLHGRLRFQGLDISVENAKGSTRRWYDPSGKETGSTLMKNHYGYIKKTRGTDGDHVDVYVGPNPDASTAYVINQMKKPAGSTRGDGAKWDRFDEQKIMLGFDSAEDAREAYSAQYDDPRFFGSMKAMTMTEFKTKVLDPDSHGKKVAECGDSMSSRLRRLRERRSDPYAKTAKVTGMHGYLTPEEVTALQNRNRPNTGIRGNQPAQFRGIIQPQKLSGLAHAAESGRGLPQAELCKGMAVESEHTADPATALQIAIDHLKESPDYYKELSKLESKMKKAAPFIDDFVEASLAEMGRGGGLAGFKLSSELLGGSAGVEELPPLTAFAKATTTKAEASDAKAELSKSASERVHRLADRIDDVGIGVLAAPYAADVVSHGMEKARNPKIRAAAGALRAAVGTESRFGKSHGRELAGLAMVAPGVTHSLARGVDKALPKQKQSAYHEALAKMGPEKTAQWEKLASTLDPDFEYLDEEKRANLFFGLSRLAGRGAGAVGRGARAVQGAGSRAMQWSQDAGSRVAQGVRGTTARASQGVSNQVQNVSSQARAGFHSGRTGQKISPGTVQRMDRVKPPVTAQAPVAPQTPYRTPAPTATVAPRPAAAPTAPPVAPQTAAATPQAAAQASQAAQAKAPGVLRPKNLLIAGAAGAAGLGLYGGYKGIQTGSEMLQSASHAQPLYPQGVEGPGRLF